MARDLFRCDHTGGDWTDAIGMDGAQVAVAQYCPDWWPAGTRLLIRRVRLDPARVSPDPRSRRRGTLHPHQRDMLFPELARQPAIYAYSFILTSLDASAPDKAAAAGHWYRHRTTVYWLPAGEVLGGGFEPVGRDEGADDQALARRQDHFGELGLRQVDFPRVARCLVERGVRSKKHRWRPLREQPADTMDTCSTCQTERYKDADGRPAYRYPPGYERKQRQLRPIVLRITKDKPPGQAFVFCFEGQLHAQSEEIPVMGGFIMCAAGPCECDGDPAKCPYGTQRPVHTIRDHDHDRCLETARSLVAEANSLPRVNQDENGNVTIVECMLLGEELVPHARRAVAAAEA